MSRSGYRDDYDYDGPNPWPASVARSIKGKRGQNFLKELAAAMDAMPEKALITDELVTADGSCCTIGVVCKARGLDVSNVEVEDSEAVGEVVGISKYMASEIEYFNDEVCENQTPEERWVRMRAWVQCRIRE